MMMKARDVGAYTITAAAARLGVSRPTIYAWLKKGKLVRAQADGLVMVDAVSLELVRNRRNRSEDS